jgi:hypothetical protein
MEVRILAQPISNLMITSKVKMGRYSVEGSPEEPIVWMVLEHNHYKDENNPDIPDHVTLITDKLIDNKAFDAKEPLNSIGCRRDRGNDRYSQSNIRQWLNKSGQPWFVKTHLADEPPTDAGLFSGIGGYEDKPGFLSGFSEPELEKIIPTNLKALLHTYDDDVSEIVTDKVFLLSAREYIAGSSDTEGSGFSFFSNVSTRQACFTQQAFDNALGDKPLSINDAHIYFTRTIHKVPASAYHGQFLKTVNITGKVDEYNRQESAFKPIGLRPALNIPLDTLVSDEPDEDGCYTLVLNQKPKIIVDDTYLGERGSQFKMVYQVDDPDLDDVLTIVERLDGQVLRKVTGIPKNTDITLTVDYETFAALTFGNHTLSITVQDDFDDTDTRTYTFTKVPGFDMPVEGQDGSEIIAAVDELLPNNYSLDRKVEWINDLEKYLFNNVIKDKILLEEKTDIIANQAGYLIEAFSIADVEHLYVNGQRYKKMMPNNYRNESYSYCEVLESGRRKLRLNPVPSENIANGLTIYRRMRPMQFDKETIMTTPPALGFYDNYKDIYLFYLLAQIAYFQKDTDDYNNHSLRFNREVENFQKYLQENYPESSESTRIKNYW